MVKKIDTMNRFLVTLHGDNVVMMSPPRGPFSKADALLLAAWIVALAAAERDEFEAVLDAVEST